MYVNNNYYDVHFTSRCNNFNNIAFVIYYYILYSFNSRYLENNAKTKLLNIILKLLKKVGYVYSM